MTTPLLGQQPSPTPSPRRSRRAEVAAIVVVTVVAVVAAVVFAVQRSGTDSGAAPAPTGSAAPSMSAAASPPASAPATTFALVPLWPFADVAAAQAWQQEYRTSGHQPWHLDPAITATAFTTGFLGYTEVDQVVGSPTVAGTQAWVAVGSKRPDGSLSTAAVLHLARIGSGADAPWEVVGSRDTDLTLTTPPYGASVSSPVQVGGRITGVDESLTLKVRTQSGDVVGHVDGVPAGGVRTPWAITVPFTAPSGTVLTVAVSTGGHLFAVERFAITGLRVS
jgi:hypothetical protein